MYGEINGVQYPVRGVVKSDKGYFSDAADEEARTVYVSYEILEGGSGSQYWRHGQCKGPAHSYKEARRIQRVEVTDRQLERRLTAMSFSSKSGGRSLDSMH